MIAWLWRNGGRAGYGLLLCAAFTGAAWTDEPLRVDLTANPAAITGDVEFWGWNIASASLEKLRPGFNQEFPNCAIHINSGGESVQSRFLLSLAAGVGAPDIAQFQCREVLRYSSTGKLADLTEVAGAYASAFPPSFWENCVYQGRLYAIPWDMGPCAVYYKRSLFKKYDIDPDAIETWDDFIAAGKELVEKSNGQTKMLCVSTGMLSDLFEILLQQSGGQIFDSEGRIAIRSQATLETIELFKKLIDSGIGANITLGGHEYFASLQGDFIATYPMAAWFGGLIRDYAPDTAGNWGIFRLPAYHPGGLRTSNLGGSVLVIPAQSKNKEAAWAFIQYCLCRPQQQIEQYRNFQLFPALLSTHQDPFFDEPDSFFDNQHIRRLFALDIDKIAPMNRTSDWAEAVLYINRALSKWASGKRDSCIEPLIQIEKHLSYRLSRPISPESLSFQPAEGGN